MLNQKLAPPVLCGSKFSGQRMSPVKGQPCERAVTSVEIDGLDMVGRPPTTDNPSLLAILGLPNAGLDGCGGGTLLMQSGGSGATSVGRVGGIPT